MLPVQLDSVGVVLLLRESLAPRSGFLTPFLGRPLFEWSLESLRRAGVASKHFLIVTDDDAIEQYRPSDCSVLRVDVPQGKARLRNERAGFLYARALQHVKKSNRGLLSFVVVDGSTPFVPPEMIRQIVFRSRKNLNVSVRTVLPDRLGSSGWIHSQDGRLLCSEELRAGCFAFDSCRALTFSTKDEIRAFERCRFLRYQLESIKSVNRDGLAPFFDSVLGEVEDVADVSKGARNAWCPFMILNELLAARIVTDGDLTYFEQKFLNLQGKLNVESPWTLLDQIFHQGLKIEKSPFLARTSTVDAFFAASCDKGSVGIERGERDAVQLPFESFRTPSEVWDRVKRKDCGIVLFTHSGKEPPQRLIEWTRERTRAGHPLCDLIPRSEQTAVQLFTDRLNYLGFREVGWAGFVADKNQKEVTFQQGLRFSFESEDLAITFSRDLYPGDRLRIELFDAALCPMSWYSGVRNEFGSWDPIPNTGSPKFKDRIEVEARSEALVLSSTPEVFHGMATLQSRQAGTLRPGFVFDDPILVGVSPYFAEWSGFAVLNSLGASSDRWSVMSQETSGNIFVS